MEDVCELVPPNHDDLGKAKKKAAVLLEFKHLRSMAILNNKQDQYKKRFSMPCKDHVDDDLPQNAKSSANAFLDMVCGDQNPELLRLKEFARIRELELAPQREMEIKLQEKLESRARISRSIQDAAGFDLNPDTRWFKFFEQTKLTISDPKMERSEEESSDVEQIIELPIDWKNPEDPVAAVMIRQEVFAQKEQRAVQAKANQMTTNLADINFEDQPANVFERMWTKVSADNKVFSAYKAIVKNIQENCAHYGRQMSACQKCFTIFRFKFPEEQHLHVFSTEFKTKVEGRVVSRLKEEVAMLHIEEALQKCFQYDALINLAREAGAYKKENGVEYIKMLRVCGGKRRRQGGVVYDHCEICANSDLEAHEEVANTMFRVVGLSKGILTIIVDIFLKRNIPHQFIKPLLHGAGLEDLFRSYRSSVPEFKSELIFRAFLIAFGNHVRKCYELDSTTQPVTHWWRGVPQIKSYKLYFIDSSKGNTRSEFDVKGRATLAHNLAERTFKTLEIYFTTGQYADFLQKYVSSPSGEQGKEKEDCIDDSSLDSESTRDDCESMFGFRKAEIMQINEAEIIRRAKISKTMLAKRNPKSRDDEIDLRDLFPSWFAEEESKAFTNAEKCKRLREKDILKARVRGAERQKRYKEKKRLLKEAQKNSAEEEN